MLRKSETSLLSDLIKEAGNRSQRGSTELASAVLDLAVTMTQWIVQKRGFHFDSIGLSIRDVGTDAVAELLTEDKVGACAPLRHQLNDVVKEGDDAQTIEAHLRVILVGTINKNITRILAEYDPVYAKCLRMLRIHIRHSKTIRVKKAVSGSWFYRGEEDDAAFHLPALRATDLRNRITLWRSDLNPSVQILESCLAFLEKQKEYRCAIHESDVMLLTLDLLGADLHAVHSESVHERDDHDYKLLLDQIETAIAETRNWCTAKHVKNGKLSSFELEAIIEAIRMFVRDSSEGESESHYYYLRQQLSGLTYDRFRSDYRNTFQYILKHFFTNARGLLVSLGYEQEQDSAGTRQ